MCECTRVNVCVCAFVFMFECMCVRRKYGCVRVWVSGQRTIRNSLGTEKPTLLQCELQRSYCCFIREIITRCCRRGRVTDSVWILALGCTVHRQLIKMQFRVACGSKFDAAHVRSFCDAFCRVSYRAFPDYDYSGARDYFIIPVSS